MIIKSKDENLILMTSGLIYTIFLQGNIQNVKMKIIIISY